MTPAPTGASWPRKVLHSLLGGGLAYVALFVGTHAFLAATASSIDPVSIAVLVVLAGCQSALMLRRDRFVSRPVAAAVCLSLIAAAIAGTWMLPAAGTVTGYAAWVYGAVTFVLLALTVAGRFAAAWLTLAGIACVALLWSVLNGHGWELGALLVVRHAATLLVGTALAIGLRRSTAVSQEFRAVERRRRADERGAEERSAARREAAGSVLRQAGPMLHAIAEGRVLTANDRAELLVVEGALRDQIRTPALVREPLTDEVAAARRRGVNVLLLDESADAADAARSAAIGWLAEALRRAEGARFVGRVRAAPDGVRVTAVTDSAATTAIFPA